MRIDEALVEQAKGLEKERNTIRAELKDIEEAIYSGFVRKPEVKWLLWRYTYYCPYDHKKLIQKYRSWPIIKCPECTYEFKDIRLGR